MAPQRILRVKAELLAKPIPGRLVFLWELGFFGKMK